VLVERDPLRPDEPTEAEFSGELELIGSTFSVLPVSQAVKHLAEGTLPERAACITFDDGYLNNFTIAAPVLEEAKLPATFFVAIDAIEKGIMWNDLIKETFAGARDFVEWQSDNGSVKFERAAGDFCSKNVEKIISEVKYAPHAERWAIAQDLYDRNVGGSVPKLMMTKEMIASLCDRGFEIGAHTVSHPILQNLPNDLARSEISDSIEWVENVTKRKTAAFAYPNGKPNVDFNDVHGRMIEEAGCVAAFSTEWNIAKHGTDLFNIPRIGAWWRSERSFLMGLIRVLIRSYT
jgi:peptidoglycan/xylan/chitin deacetylase (PgdA/CDA1 family)